MAELPSGVDVARYRELAIQRITYTHDERGTAKLSAALHLTQQALAEAAAALTASEAERERVRVLATKAMGWLDDNAKCGDNCAVCIAYSRAGADEIRTALESTP